jgi:hypothetical protein
MGNGVRPRLYLCLAILGVVLGLALHLALALAL